MRQKNHKTEKVSLLDRLRTGLLRLHKSLVVRERISYERIHGRIESSGQLLHLLIHDQHFEWLHGISELLVRIDETLENKQAETDEIDLLFVEAKALLKAVEEGNEFQKKYYAAIQEDPDVTLAHGEVWKALREFPQHD